MRDRGGRAEGPQRRGSVEAALVVGGTDGAAEMRHRLQADQIGGEERVGGGQRPGIEGRQERRHDHRGGVPAHARVDVVVVEHVSGIAIEQGGEKRFCGPSGADHRGPAGRVAHGSSHGRDGAVPAPREGAGEKVDQRQARRRHRGGFRVRTGCHDGLSQGGAA